MIGGAAALGRLREQATAWEGKWFDLTRGVDTSGYEVVSRLTLAGTDRAGFNYLPIRPSRARQVLRELPIEDPSEYSFVDLGSGKGRMLFIACELAFQRIVGVEFAQELHLRATQNIASYRSAKRRCRHMESVYMDAADYPMPPGKLVLYLFNPFGPTVLRKVLKNLEASLRAEPRHVVVALLWPDYAGVLEEAGWLQSFRNTPHYRIYQTG